MHPHLCRRHPTSHVHDSARVHTVSHVHNNVLLCTEGMGGLLVCPACACVPARLPVCGGCRALPALGGGQDRRAGWLHILHISTTLHPPVVERLLLLLQLLAAAAAAECKCHHGVRVRPERVCMWRGSPVSVIRTPLPGKACVVRERKRESVAAQTAPHLCRWWE